MPTMLTLAPAWGGTRFGPFSGRTSIGADASCTVVVSGPGVAGCHVWVVERGSLWSLEPAAPGATVFVSRKGGPMTLARGSTGLSAGDAFALGTEQGVTFFLGGPVASGPVASGPVASGPVASGPAVAGAPRGGRRGPPTVAQLGAEAQRQAGAEAMRLGPVQDVQRFLFRLKAGTFFQPRYIVAALFAAAGGSCTLCSGAGAAAWAWMNA